MKKTILSSVVVGLLFSVFAVPFAFGQNNQESLQGGSGFRVSPPRRTITIEPGRTVSEEISIRNVTERDQIAVALVEDFIAADDESGNPQIILDEPGSEPTPYSIRPFVQPISNLPLAPGEEERVLITFTVPEAAAPGSYFGVVRFVDISEADTTEGTTNVSLNASVGIIFLVNVPGETIDIVNLEEAGVSKNGSTGSVFASAPDTFFMRLRNEGNTFQAPRGDIRVTDWNGTVVQEVNFNSENPPANVLPDSIRRFNVDLENIGSFGRYTVSGFISYGNGSNIIEINTTFWVIPWVSVLIIATLAIAAIFFATRGLKAYNRSVIKKAKGKSQKSMK